MAFDGFDLLLPGLDGDAGSKPIADEFAALTEHLPGKAGVYTNKDLEMEKQAMAEIAKLQAEMEGEPPSKPAAEERLHTPQTVPPPTRTTVNRPQTVPPSYPTKTKGPGSASSDDLDLDESLDNLIGDLTKVQDEKDRKKAEVFGTPVAVVEQPAQEEQEPDPLQRAMPMLQTHQTVGLEHTPPPPMMHHAVSSMPPPGPSLAEQKPPSTADATKLRGGFTGHSPSGPSPVVTPDKGFQQPALQPRVVSAGPPIASAIDTIGTIETKGSRRGRPTTAGGDNRQMVRSQTQGPAFSQSSSPADNRGLLGHTRQS